MNDNIPLSARAHAQPHRKAVLIALLWITMAAGAVFATLNLRAGNLPLAVVEIAMASYSLFLMWAVRRTRHLDRWLLAYSLPFFSAMMFALYVPRSTVSVFGWILLVPILSHLLHGRKLGLAISLFFTGIGAVIFLFRFHDSPLYMEPIPLLNMGILTLCVLTFSHVYEVSRERSENKLLRLARTDFLTGLANRVMFEEMFEKEKHRAQRELTPLSLILLDLDFFKSVNDRYGHEMGDRVLVHVARLIRKRLRLSDLACRFGGEEFAIILPDTHIRQAMAVAEQLRATVADHPLVDEDTTIKQTMSLGVAEIGPDGSTLEDLLAQADERLYMAKGKGRNQVVGPLWIDTETADA
ncbi:GGDEF domain-containing protein [Marinobacter halodurans]|uniref:diguanylate cyclase n=1 Tax=Marinobacter halodurans TaxID=2528979 RepID=A0ABY1ZR28_9GAMM|nr:GGDEF domain-containing protein [Marinobacter halodurans]TBW59580.1 GGDEF domain-containing protein [Marinobacter halodurans]